MFPLFWSNLSDCVLRSSVLFLLFLLALAAERCRDKCWVKYDDACVSEAWEPCAGLILLDCLVPFFVRCLNRARFRLQSRFRNVCSSLKHHALSFRRPTCCAMWTMAPQSTGLPSGKVACFTFGSGFSFRICPEDSGQATCLLPVDGVEDASQASCLRGRHCVRGHNSCYSPTARWGC